MCELVCFSRRKLMLYNVPSLAVCLRLRVGAMETGSHPVLEYYGTYSAVSQTSQSSQYVH